MKKQIIKVATTAFAAAAIVVPALTSCGGDKAKKAEEESAKLDSVVSMVQEVLSADSAASAEEASAEEAKDMSAYVKGGDMPYKADFFTNAANKAATVTAGDGKYAETASGLKYAVIKSGEGARPKATDVVTVNYAGRLTDLDGTQFDSSYDRGEPTSFPLNRVIAGWTEGLQLMQPGAVYEFYIPADIAYGERGAGPIPPNAPLLFKVELISFTPAQ
ncbi:FKBP-type peptidyl-prolyl cis-trans isomerase [bacterium]|nr:FKBP-type peptidyl-prolyl cis-trans isomerase [bacterium]